MTFFSPSLFKIEFRRRFIGLLIWSLALGASMYLVVILFPMVQDMYAAMPPEFAAIMEQFGGLPTNGLEYFSTEGGMMFQLFGALYVALEGFNIITRDERERTVEAIFALPLSRTQLFVTKYASVVTNILLFSLINYGFSLIGFIQIGEDINMGDFTLFFALTTLMFLVIATLSLSLASYLKVGVKSGIAIAIPFPLYILYIISTMTSNEILKNLKYITPFTFADPVGIFKADYELPWLNLIIFVLLAVSGFISAMICFKRRDILI